MSPRSKAFLPGWVAWVIVPVVVLAWGLMSWRYHETDEVALVEYLLVTAILAAVCVMIVLMAAGKLPAYVIEDEEDERGETGEIDEGA